MMQDSFGAETIDELQGREVNDQSELSRDEKMDEEEDSFDEDLLGD